MPYEMQLMRALGADSVEEAMQIAEAAGLKPEDIPKLLESQGLTSNKDKPPKVELTRR